MSLLSSLPSWMLDARISLVAGLCSGGLWVARAHARDVDAGTFVSVIRKIIASGDVPRAIKITDAGHAMPLCAATKAAILASVRLGAPERAAQGGYRGRSDAARALLLPEIFLDYDAAFRNAAAPLGQALLFAVPSPFLILFAVAVSLDERSPTAFSWVVVVAALAMLALVYAGFCHLRIVLSRETVFRQLAPLFEQIARDGGRAVEARERTIAT
ncbi:hypothetical protein [Polyangium sp. 15x6]|uniref:hypothetical protein n=1 Tax=Polyangium sp. 15x6 TaxID=3042687 RepID=UPI00249A8DA1|nr:hypothetical protein [Polyangium sp. 15x6]MDI3292186.1 hypothetical protein [Polyangium sp. 15x6]